MVFRSFLGVAESSASRRSLRQPRACIRDDGSLPDESGETFWQQLDIVRTSCDVPILRMIEGERMAPLVPGDPGQVVDEGRAIEPIESGVTLVDQDHAQFWNPERQSSVCPGDLARRERPMTRRAEQLVRIRPECPSANLPLIGADRF